MLNYAELREIYKNIRIKQGIGLLVEANRAPRIRIRQKALSASHSFVYTLCMLLCVAFWAFIALWAFGG